MRVILFSSVLLAVAFGAASANAGPVKPPSSAPAKAEAAGRVTAGVRTVTGGGRL